MNRHRENPTYRRALLKSAAKALSSATASLHVISTAIDGQIATYTPGPEFEPHPLVEGMEVRKWPTPPGATYNMLEVRAAAGAHGQHASNRERMQMHVISGEIQIYRHETGQQQVYGAATVGEFRAGEPYGFLVLQDTHNIVIYHPNPPTTT